MYEFLLAILLAVLFAAVLAWPLGWRHHRVGGALAAWVFTLLILLPLIWLAALWLPRIGPATAGVYWLAPALVGLLLIFVIAAAAPPARGAPPRARLDEPPAETVDGAPEARNAGLLAIFIDAMFWIFFLGAIALLIIGYST